MYSPSSKLDDSAPPPPPAPVTGFPVAAPLPNLGAVLPKTRQLWSTGLFDCADDCGNCCITCWCPCVTFGRIADIEDGGSSSCGASGALYALIAVLSGCQWIYSWYYRSKLRAQYHLPESPCCDCCVHFWCEPCALCQEYRELEARGFDMTIGWHLNMERRQQAGGMVGMTPPPTMQDGMMR